jgi:hypothetical protein
MNRDGFLLATVLQILYFGIIVVAARLGDTSNNKMWCPAAGYNAHAEAAAIR